MLDDVLVNKTATVERCVARAREAVLDMGQHLVRREFTRIVLTRDGAT